MACHCKDDIEKRLTVHYADKLPKSKEVSAALMGYGLYISEKGCEEKPHMSVEVRHTTTSKAGVERRKTEKANMTFNFCPFCGTSLKAAPKEAP